MHTIRTDLERGLVEVEVTGFWTVDHIADFAQDMARETDRIRASGRQQNVLYDYTRASIQSQEVIAALKSLARANSFATRKVALYTGGQLARMQARRVAEEGSRFCVFDDRETALAWLMS